MKTLSILLVSSSLLLGCGSKLPVFPTSIKSEYVFDIDTRGTYNCFEFEIIGLDPYTVRFKAVVPLVNCSGLSGYVIRDRVQFNDWLAQTQKIAKELKCR